MVAWVIGVVLSFLGIYLYKGSRLSVVNRSWENKTVLRMWSLILFLIGSLIPFFNIAMAIIMVIWWVISVYVEEFWVYPKDSAANRFIQFLNKPIK